MLRYGLLEIRVERIGKCEESVGKTKIADLQPLEAKIKKTGTVKASQILDRKVIEILQGDVYFDIF